MQVNFPLINPPNVGILACGQIQRRPKVLIQNGAEKIIVRDMMFFSFSFDHRIINGSIADNFLAKVEYWLNNELWK